MHQHTAHMRPEPASTQAACPFCAAQAPTPQVGRARLDGERIRWWSAGPWWHRLVRYLGGGVLVAMAVRGMLAVAAPALSPFRLLVTVGVLGVVALVWLVTQATSVPTRQYCCAICAGCWVVGPDGGWPSAERARQQHADLRLQAWRAPGDGSGER